METYKELIIKLNNPLKENEKQALSYFASLFRGNGFKIEFNDEMIKIFLREINYYEFKNYIEKVSQEYNANILTDILKKVDSIKSYGISGNKRNYVDYNKERKVKDRKQKEEKGGLSEMLELNKIYNMDCLEGMKLIDDNSIDSIVTDPPYELGFMGKSWDSTGIAYNIELWKECLRILKPGGHLLAFGGTRTYHRMACAIEDAGFEIRDSIQYFFATNNMAQEFVESLTQEQSELFWRLLDTYGFAGQMAWIYGSGFPKSMDVSKAFDKRAGAERKKGRLLYVNGKTAGGERIRQLAGGAEHYETFPATPLAKKWDGWGTALKPAHEPIILARKPLDGTVVNNVERWGTGALNIDGCRIGTKQIKTYGKRQGKGVSLEWSKYTSPEGYEGGIHQGRFPANVILDEEAGKLLDEQSGILKSGTSRFFYCAKASKKERGEGNNHPTVKPLSLIKYLVTLVTPPDGVCLDPFMGSGTTAIACIKTNRKYIGFELSEEYCKIANERIQKALAEKEVDKC